MVAAMDCCVSSTPEAAVSRQIDRKIKEDKKKFSRQMTILLLGTGESGKSTFLKQMVIIHGSGEFTDSEKKEYRATIYWNVVQSMKVLCDAAVKLQIPFRLPASEAHMNTLFGQRNIRAQLDYMTFYHTFYKPVKDLWMDTAIQTAYDRRVEFQLVDSCKYFFDHIDRVSQPDYVPTHRDILMCRKPTRNVYDTCIVIENVPFRFIDVGGQRKERMKWFQCFINVTSILFMVASSEFDQAAQDNRGRNRVDESRDVFDSIANHRQFRSESSGTSIIVFFNKRDLLDAKVRHSNITDYLPGEFVGSPSNADHVMTFLRNYFLSAIKKDDTQGKRVKDLQIYMHETTAVDTDQITRVFHAVRQTILEINLQTLMMS